VTALRLYESLGFRLRRPATFVVARAPVVASGRRPALDNSLQTSACH
jgi:hypothetical protein